MIFFMIFTGLILQSNCTSGNFMQGEIGVLFPLIVLRSLDSSESSLSQRSSVLR